MESGIEITFQIAVHHQETLNQTAYIYIDISKERRCNEDLRSIGELKID